MRFLLWSEVMDVIPKESKLKIGRLNILGFENQKIKEYNSRESSGGIFDSKSKCTGFESAPRHLAGHL